MNELKKNEQALVLIYNIKITFSSSQKVELNFQYSFHNTVLCLPNQKHYNKKLYDSIRTNIQTHK